MTWKRELWGGCEAAKVAAIVVPYLQGRCLDIGSGQGKVWPSLIGIDTATDGGRPITDMCMDGTDLSMFTDGSFDGVFSSFLLQEIAPEKTGAVLKEWARVIRPGGHLVLYLPFKVPPVGSDDAPAEWRWSPSREQIFSHLKSRGGWYIHEDEVRNDGDEYGMLIVARKSLTDGQWVERPWQRSPEGKKRALVVRYGAIGDAFVAASILPGLKAQGYHVTFNAHPSTKDVLLHDPHIDEWLIQGKDFVPNHVLGPYWSALRERYDKVINLCESVEGLLLSLPGRLNHGYSDEARRALYDDVNYLEHTHRIAGVPFEFSNARFHMTTVEREKAQYERNKMKGPVVVWCINGSSPHKVWPWVQIVTAWLVKKTPAHVVLFADPGPAGTTLLNAIVETLKENKVEMARVHAIGGSWPLRKALAFCHVADCVVGPETGPLNAVGMMPVPKVIYLSHSTEANLTKHWKNCTALVPKNVSCYSCHRLHYTWEFCNKSEETGAALCASSISPEVVFSAIAESIGAVNVRKSA